MLESTFALIVLCKLIIRFYNIFHYFFARVWSHNQNKCVECPAGWIPSNLRCYLLIKEFLTFEDSRRECEKKNASLAIVHDNTTLASIRKILDGKNDYFRTTNYELVGSAIYGPWARKKVFMLKKY